MVSCFKEVLIACYIGIKMDINMKSCQFFFIVVSKLGNLFFEFCSCDCTHCTA